MGTSKYLSFKGSLSETLSSQMECCGREKDYSNWCDLHLKEVKTKYKTAILLFRPPSNDYQNFLKTLLSLPADFIQNLH
jgi:hypothetical protein